MRERVRLCVNHCAAAGPRIHAVASRATLGPDSWLQQQRSKLSQPLPALEKRNRQSRRNKRVAANTRQKKSSSAASGIPDKSGRDQPMGCP
ncbi:hypothetical protein NDU88_004579 [Pleurodeles waltl]|uniref:Uncharacterized protein n=1 Tax=Pleurodeles waltl TaxID=8319 RepID=A0AAV7MEE5_PLEWA|nr:hypothetical protein NDU88_004579 [Pleurodeles waltl]